MKNLTETFNYQLNPLFLSQIRICKKTVWQEFFWQQVNFP